jgi:hypothetical protein
VRLCARLAGDEFVLLIDGAGTDAAAAAHTAWHSIAATPVDLGPRELRITVTIGVASSAVGYDQLLARADHAMYRAKRTGRGLAVHQLPATLRRRRLRTGGWIPALPAPRHTSQRLWYRLRRSAVGRGVRGTALRLRSRPGGDQPATSPDWPPANYFRPNRDRDGLVIMSDAESRKPPPPTGTSCTSGVRPGRTEPRPVGAPNAWSATR